MSVAWSNCHLKRRWSVYDKLLPCDPSWYPSACWAVSFFPIYHNENKFQLPLHISRRLISFTCFLFTLNRYNYFWFAFIRKEILLLSSCVKATVFPWVCDVPSLLSSISLQKKPSIYLQTWRPPADWLPFHAKHPRLISLLPPREVPISLSIIVQFSTYDLQQGKNSGGTNTFSVNSYLGAHHVSQIENNPMNDTLSAQQMIT